MYGYPEMLPANQPVFEYKETTSPVVFPTCWIKSIDTDTAPRYIINRDCIACLYIEHISNVDEQGNEIEDYWEVCVSYVDSEYDDTILEDRLTEKESIALMDFITDRLPYGGVIDLNEWKAEQEPEDAENIKSE